MANTRLQDDPTDPTAARKALLDSLNPDSGTAPTTAVALNPGGAQPTPTPPASGPLDPSAGPNPVSTPGPAAPPARLADPPADPLRAAASGAGLTTSPAAPASVTGARPTGSLSDPAYRQAFIAWAAQQPGVNPSVKNDPNYWDQAFASGRFKDDSDYAFSRMMQAEGPPEGAAPQGFSGSNATNFQASLGGLDPNTAAYNQRMRDFMTSQIGVLSGPTNAQSEDIAPALSAYDTQSQRDQQAERDAIAERFYATGGEGGAGLQSGGFTTAVQQGREAAAGNRANFAGTTIFNAAQAKRTQLNELLKTAVSSGMTEQAQQIQMQIANIDAQLRAQGLSQQDRQFGANLAQQHSQFGDQLGFDYAQLQSQQNRDALLAGMNG